MTLNAKWAAVASLLTPLTAFAKTEGAPPEFLYALGGGALGGFVGALLACWLCKRMSSGKNRDSDR